MSSYEFRMWGIRKRDRQKPYQVRWLVAGLSHAETFVTRALAESFRAELMSAARAGEAFDEVTGLPESRARDVPWFDHAMSYVDTSQEPRLERILSEIRTHRKRLAAETAGDSPPGVSTLG